VAPSGVFVIDTKAHRGRVELVDLQCLIART